MLKVNKSNKIQSDRKRKTMRCVYLSYCWDWYHKSYHIEYTKAPDDYEGETYLIEWPDRGPHSVILYKKDGSKMLGIRKACYSMYNKESYDRYMKIETLAFRIKNGLPWKEYL